MVGSAFFVEFARRAVESAGLVVTEQSDDCLLVNGHWFDLDGLFYRRNIEDAFSKLTAWFAARAVDREPEPGGYQE